jgi:hypothetical protein
MNKYTNCSSYSTQTLLLHLIPQTQNFLEIPDKLMPVLLSSISLEPSLLEPFGHQFIEEVGEDT